MITVPKNLSSQKKLESNQLASKARIELLELGEVKTDCPKCRHKIEIVYEENRISITCPCHYICVHEIAF